MLKRDRPSVVGSKRHGSSLALKRHRSSVVELLLPHDVVELILERLPVESLLRFKSVSNKWKSTIASRCFQERQFIRRMQSRGPDVLFVYLTCFGDDGLNTDARRIVQFGSSIVRTVRFPASGSMICHGSCDGLLCIYCFEVPSVVVNPATGWSQRFPLSNIQQLLIDKYNKGTVGFSYPELGFGKDKFTGTYKPVWLYNSSEFGLDNVTTCEVFDFSTNAWRYVLPASPYRILAYHTPVYLDGSLYWFTECEETKLLSFDLHKETFQVISKAPFSHLRDPCNVTMCILDNRLCVSEKNWPTQDMWSFDSSGDHKTWKKMYSIDLTKTFSWFGEPKFPLSPIAILEKNKLLLQSRDCFDPLVIHDLHTKSYDLLFKSTKPIGSVYYFQSLFSALSN
ncbi:F-box domain [Arabidopsis suecica]|uniref:F-box domain n=2 Tax=Arabidopsis suecica TaxID=45249 RepID=A0A8T1ZXY5_ARASU|nr:F-box domain [Arabidopsis suecica]KAG7564800.1 F-box domain [Arabidopsis suecica]